MWKRNTTEKKAQIVLEILKEEKTVARIDSEYGGQPNPHNKDIHFDYLNRLK